MKDDDTKPGVPAPVRHRPSTIIRRREFDIDTLWEETERRLRDFVAPMPLSPEIVTIVRTFGARCWNSGRDSVVLDEEDTAGRGKVG